jgi:nucleoid DNA-binding protein
MNRAEFVRAVASDCYESIDRIDDILRSVENVMIKTFSNGEEIRFFAGFKFAPTKIKESKKYNPTTEEFNIVPEHYVCKLRTTNVFTERINKKDDSDIEE